LHRPAYTGLPSQDLTVAPYLFNSGQDRSDPNVPNYAVNQRATSGPGGTTPLPQVNHACVPGLSGLGDANWNLPNSPEWATNFRSVLNRELILLRPRRASGDYSTGMYHAITANGTTYPALAYNEVPNPAAGYTNLRDLVPFDSFD